MTIHSTIRSARARVLSSLRPLPPDFTDWASILKPDSARWKAARDAAKDGPKVLIANCAGIDAHVTTVDSLLAVALTLRGADVHILLCDEALPACWISSSHRIPPQEFVKAGPSRELCGKCFVPGSAVFRPLGLPVHRYGELLSRSDLQKAAELSSRVPVDKIENFCLDGLEVGEQAYAAALRYYTRGDLRDEPEGEGILRRYLQASLLSVFAVGRLMSKFPFESVCGIHGMYVPEGVIGEVARSRNVRAVSWNDSYLKQTFIFGLNDTYHRTMLAESIASVETLPWTAKMESEIVEYLRSRWYGTHDWIRYTQDWSEDVLSIGAELGIDFNKPCVGLLTNIIWDAQVHYGGNAFSNMLEWTLETIKYFANRPDLQLIVRVHPAEVRHSRGSRQLMADEIKRAIPELPKNVFVIPPDSRMNTYTAMMKCNAVIIYGTKAGVELTSFGIPVIVAGEAWIRNKRLTLDASSPQEYFAILDRLPLADRMSDEAVRRARKYAYHFFFRRQIPVPVLHQANGSAFSKLEISGIEDLRPERYPGLDIICNGIIRGDEFIFPAESYPEKLVTSGKFTASSVELSVNPNRKPLVSVVIPARDHGDGLEEALDSVYAQNGAGRQFDMDVIVVENGSAAGRSRFASRYNGIRYIELEKASPLSAVRNAGIKEANGQYVAFLDGDNVWLPERLRSHIALLEHYPEFGAAYGQFVTTGAGADAVYPEAGAAPAGSVFKAFAIEQFAFPSVLTVRRETFRTAGHFDEKLRAMEDYDMLLRLAFVARFAFVAGPGGTVRFSADRTWLARIQRGEH
ncbi:MAG: glycosyltransferase, partial [Candidatus Binatia bacterium]